ncbi:MAG TPA: PAS domain S-box protein, partial [Polyangiaceae bacterium]
MDKAPYLAEYSAVALGGPKFTLEAHFEPLGRYFSISVAPLGPGAFATIFFDVTEAKQQARAIENSRMCLRALLDNLPHWAWLKDNEGRYLAVNRAFAAAYGIDSPDDLVGKSDVDLVSEERATATQRDDTDVMKLGPRKYTEQETSGDGDVRWLEIHKSPLVACDGSVSGTTGVARDITDWRLAEAAAEAARQELAQYFNLSLDLMCIAKVNGQFVRVNPAWERILGYSSSQLEGSSFLDLVHPEDHDETLRATRQLGEGRLIPDFLNRFRHADGSWRWLEWHSTPDEGGYIYAMARDVTERQAAELALRAAEQKAARSREQLLSVAEMAHIGHFSIDFAKDAVDWTPEFFRILGLAPGSLVPTIEASRACIHPDDLPELDAAMRAAIDIRAAARLHLRVLRSNGEVRHCLTIIEGDDDATGNPIVLGLVQDLTDLKRAEVERLKLEQQVMQSQKLESLGVLAGGIAHDFNNLLTSILGNADLALTELSPVNPARVYLDDIEQVSRRAADLCRQMLAYSGKGKFVVQALSLNEVVREMAYLLGVSISKKVTIKYNFFDGLPSVVADATQLRQIVMNLITNASEAIGEASGIVTLTTGVMDCDEAYLSSVVGDSDCHAPGQYVYLEVCDTGCGMDAETMSRIFDPFFTTKFTG